MDTRKEMNYIKKEPGKIQPKRNNRFAYFMDISPNLHSIRIKFYSNKREKLFAVWKNRNSLNHFFFDTITQFNYPKFHSESNAGKYKKIFHLSNKFYLYFKYST